MTNDSTQRRRRLLRDLVWPTTFPRRWAFALMIYLPPTFIASLIVGAVKGLDLPAIMLEIWLWTGLIATVIATAQAAAGVPGQSFWKSPLRR